MIGYATGLGLGVDFLRPGMRLANSARGTTVSPRTSIEFAKFGHGLDQLGQSRLQQFELLTEQDELVQRAALGDELVDEAVLGE